MAPRLIPEDPRFTTVSERAVWERLRDTLRDDDTLLANWRLTDSTKDHEADLVVVMADRGVVVVEVKGAGTCFHDDAWFMRTAGSQRQIDPVGQARDAKYALRRFIESDPRWADSSRRRVRFAHTVVLPFSTLDEGFRLAACPRWLIHDRSDQEDLAARIAEIPLRLDVELPAPDGDDCDVIVDIMTGSGVQLLPDVESDSAERRERADRLTQEQATLLGVTRLLRRVEVRGGAGSGKTVLALAQAKQLTRGRSGTRQERVALVCYSLGLAGHLERAVRSLKYNQRPAFVGTFESLANLWGIESGSRDDPAFWEEHLPVMMAERATQLPPEQRFDSFVVDEAQDFAASWWRPLVAALRDEAEGGMFLYSDENQRLFHRFGGPPFPLVPLVLDHNLRNTRQIAEVFRPLAPHRMRLDGGEGPEVMHVQVGPDEALGAADDQVEALLDEGWAPGSIALLTTGQRHPEQRSRQSLDGQSGYWDSYWDQEQIFYGHVLGFKGLERRAVVLCVNEDGTRERFRERIYVGLSRATDRLVVVGDIAAIERAEADVARNLERSSRA